MEILEFQSAKNRDHETQTKEENIWGKLLCVEIKMI